MGGLLSLSLKGGIRLDKATGEATVSFLGWDLRLCQWLIAAMSVTQEDRLSCYELQVLCNFMFVKLESQVSHKQSSTTTVVLIRANENLGPVN